MISSGNSIWKKSGSWSRSSPNAGAAAVQHAGSLMLRRRHAATAIESPRENHRRHRVLGNERVVITIIIVVVKTTMTMTGKILIPMTTKRIGQPIREHDQRARSLVAVHSTIPAVVMVVVVMIVLQDDRNSNDGAMLAISKMRRAVATQQQRRLMQASLAATPPR